VVTRLGDPHDRPATPAVHLDLTRVRRRLDRIALGMARFCLSDRSTL
jgi:hypothetical protein